jgi:N-acylneuraminate cytidylyltransferase
MRIAVIPARGGSKRIPRKNIRNFCGKPMVAWSIDAALKSGCIDRVIVSTDDPEIAAVAREYGADVPFMRPTNLADDYAGTTAVLQHAVQWLISQGADVSETCCLYATAPFVAPEDLCRGLELLTQSRASYAFSVTTYSFPIQRALKLTEAGLRIAMFHPEHADTRSQDLEEAYHDAGQFYWGTKNAWLAAEAIYADHSVPVMLPRYRVQDIDTPEDWERAVWMFEAMRHHGKA